VNQAHVDFLSSPEWMRMLETDLIPWFESVGDLGDDVLEIGPGPGLTTDLLRNRVAWLTAVEIDPTLARPLKERLRGTNVEVMEGDAASCGFDPDRFSAVTCFAVLHHMPSRAHQDRVFRELGRTLAPGGLFVGNDSLDTERTRRGHEGDIYTPIDPTTLGNRLESAGLRLTQLDEIEYQFRFVAIKDAPSHTSPPSLAS
jgi:SAM-dependent methyltransferase